MRTEFSAVHTSGVRNFRVGFALCLVALLFACSGPSPAGPVSVQQDPNGALYGTWAFDGSNWAQLAPNSEAKTLGPREQLFYSAALGGLIDMDGTKWSGGAWVSDGKGPILAPLESGQVTIDEANGQLLRFDPVAKTIWAWSDRGWTSVLPATQWPATNSMSGGSHINVGAVAYDPARKVVLMLSCCSPEAAGLETTNWRTSSWDGMSLTEVSESKDVVAQFLVPDGLGHMLGFGFAGPFSWDGKNWSALKAEASLPVGVQAIGADPAHRQIIAIGIASSGLETWAWRDGAWALIRTAKSPPAGGVISNLAYDPVLPGFVLTELPFAGCCANLP
jgi:hypothetical protein